MIESSMSKTMMMDKVMTYNWSEDDELLRELLVDESPLQVTNTSHDFSKDQPFNRFISNIYSGPTISDIENALLVTNHSNHFQQISSTRYEHFNIFLLT